MGIINCSCYAQYDENKEAISKLVSLRRNKEKDRQELKARLLSETEIYKKYQKNAGPKKEDTDKIKQCENEIKLNEKLLSKSRKKTLILEDSIQQYTEDINDMEHTINTLQQEKKTAAEEKKRAEAEAEEKAKNDRETQHTKHTPQPTTFRIPDIMEGLNLMAGGMDNLADNITSALPKFTNRLSLSESNTKSQALPFTIKDRRKPTDKENASASLAEYNSCSSDENAAIEMKDTITLDIASGYDATADATQIHSYLFEQKIDNSKPDIKLLKVSLAELLTARSEGHRQKIKQSYRKQYENKLEKDIKKVIQKGHTLEIIHGLLMTRAQYDAVLIKEYVANWDILPVADIICCRTMFQLKELHVAYKQKCKQDVKKQLQALAIHEKHKTLSKVIASILDLKRKEDTKVDINEVNGDLNFVLTTPNFKGETKERLITIFTANSVQYIKVLNDQFRLKSKDSLTTFIDKNLSSTFGGTSTAGYYCKTRIEYALNTPEYYAQKIKTLGKNYKKNQKKIADIFMQRMETDLEIIQRVWKIKKHADGKQLSEWIETKTGGSKSGNFLIQMLKNCSRYTEFIKNDAKGKPKSKIEQMMIGN